MEKTNAFAILLGKSIHISEISDLVTTSFKYHMHKHGTIINSQKKVLNKLTSSAEYEQSPSSNQETKKQFQSGRVIQISGKM